MIRPELSQNIQSLRERGYQVLDPTPGPGESFVIFPAFAVQPGRYNRDTTRLLVRIPVAYPNAALDMFYTQPDFLLPSGAPPRAAEVLENLIGELWRRFSWHRNVAWVPGRDSLLSFVSFIEDNLARGQ